MNKNSTKRIYYLLQLKLSGMKTKLLLSVVLLTVIGSSMQAQDYWTRLPDFQYGVRGGAVSVSIGEKAYMGLGVGAIWYNDFWEFDPETNAWTQLARFPGQARQAAVAFALNGKIYAGTGVYNRTAYKDFYEYNPASNTWTQKADYGGGYRYTAMSFTIGDKGYVGAGKDQGLYWGTFDFWEYNPTTDTWTQRADIGNTENGYVRRSTGVGFSVAGQGYIGMGMQDYDTRRRDLLEYNPETNKWTRKADFPDFGINGYGRWCPVSFTIGNKAFVGTGYFANPYPAYNDIWEYNPKTDTWTQRANVATVGRGQGIGFTIGNKGYVGLGYNNAGHLSDLWTYTPGVFVQCPTTQTLCYDASNTYAIPLLSFSTVCEENNITYKIEGATSRTGIGPDASGTFNAGQSVITWTVTDCIGNSTTGSTTVNINNPISISIPNLFAVNPGGELNTIYIGYGPTSLTYQATVSGGTPFADGTYNYLWSTNETSRSIIVNPSTAGLYNYIVTVTDAMGCSDTYPIFVNVVDVRCGNKMDKVSICKVPPGNPENTLELCVSKSAVASHLASGSRLGDCYTFNPQVISEDQWVVIFPNPSKGEFTIQLTDPASIWCEIRIMDRDGKLIELKVLNTLIYQQVVPFDLSGQPKGMYYVRVLNGEGLQMFKILVE